MSLRAVSIARLAGALLVSPACSRSPSFSQHPMHASAADASHAVDVHIAHASDAAIAPTRPLGPAGTVEGVVYLDGPIRRGPAIPVQPAWQNRPGCRDAALRYAWPFDATTPGVFPGALVAAEAHAAAPATPQSRVMTFRDCDITPRALFSREGDRILFRADTRQNHLPHITGSGASIDQVLIPSQGDQERRISGPGRYPVTVRDLPEFVGAVLFVLPNRFIDTTDTVGHFRIADVPVGNVVVHAWYPGTAEARNVVAITAGHTSTVDFHLQQAAEPSHSAHGADAGPIPQ